MLKNSQPLYLSIAEILTKDIMSEKLKKGDSLPTEAKLCQIFNVSRVTVRQALQLLVEKGFVEKKQGSGTKVIYSKQSDIMNRSAKIISFREEMVSMGKKPSSTVLKFEWQKASPFIASKLKLSIGAPVYYYERILTGNDLPCNFETGYLSADHYPDFSVKHLMHSKFHYIEKVKKQTIDYSYQSVDAIVADEYLSKILCVPINTPLIKLSLVTYLDTSEAFDFNTAIFDSSRYHAYFIKYRERIKRTESNHF